MNSSEVGQMPPSEVSALLFNVMVEGCFTPSSMTGRVRSGVALSSNTGLSVIMQTGGFPTPLYLSTAAVLT